MQLIESIILIIITALTTNLFTRKFYISDKDRIVKEKQFEIYNKLSLNIAKDSLNRPINSGLARTNIYKLIDEVSHSSTLINYLSPKLYEYLLFSHKNGITNNILGNIQLQIETDLEQIKYNLGYPCKLKYKTRLVQTFGILLTAFTMILYFIITIKKQIPIIVSK